MTVINVVELLFKALPEPMSIWDVKVRDTDVLFTWRGIRVADVLV